MFDYGHIFPQKTLWFGEKSAFFSQKKADFTLFRNFSASQPSWSAKNDQNITLQLRQNSGETDLVTLIHQNMSKIGCFWAFSHFFCFWGPFFENFEPKICFFINQMWNEISQMTDAPIPLMVSFSWFLDYDFMYSERDLTHTSHFYPTPKITFSPLR